MIMLTWIRKAYKVLSADASPEAIAFAVAFGIMAGFLPLGCGLSLVLIALMVIFRVQLTTALAFWAIGALVRTTAALPFLVEVGRSLLEAESRHEFWIWFLNLPVVAWLGLETYAVLGGAVFGFLLGAVLFVPVRYLVIAYRKWAHEKVSENKFFRWSTNFWLIKVLRFVFVGS